MGEPQREYPSVHIAGTKGKGSTTLLLESLLLASGYRVGAYTSPHVEHLTERVRAGGRPISEAAILEELNSILPILERRRSGADGLFPSFFELMTALATKLAPTNHDAARCFETANARLAKSAPFTACKTTFTQWCSHGR